MKTKNLIFFILLQTLSSVVAKSQNSFDTFADSTRTCIMRKDLEKAYLYSLKALSHKEDNKNISSFLYDSSVLAVRAGEVDLGFYFLGEAIKDGYYNYSHAVNNKDFPKDDTRWKICLERIKRNDSIITYLSNELDTIFKIDQSIRLQWVELEERGFDEKSDTIQKLLRRIVVIDSLNARKIDQLISEHGYYGQSLKTFEARNAVFTIIQHSDIIFMKKYLPVFKEAEKRGEFDKPLLAYLEDRIMLSETGKQKYGTQYSIIDNEIIFSPLVDPENVDKFRKELGLDSLADYKKAIMK